MEVHGRCVEVTGSVLDIFPWKLTVTTAINFLEIVVTSMEASPLPCAFMEVNFALPWNLHDKTSVEVLDSFHGIPRASKEPILTSM